MDIWFKKNGIHFAIVGIFIAICFIYFTPAFKGKTIGQNDVTRAQSTQKEIMDYRAKDSTILWTNQILGGMPTYQIWAPYKDNITTHLVSAIKNIFPNPVDTVMLLLLGSYLLFCVLRINPWLSAAGAIAFTFSSYNFILLVAGHANQAFAIAFFAPIIAGIILTLRGKYLLGSVLTALFLALEIRANHLQMTYYLMIALIILVIIEIYQSVKNKNIKSLLKPAAYLTGSVILAIAVNASILWSTYEYSKETYRGKSNLTKNTQAPSNGLDKEYAYQWSQGVMECLTFLVPNAYGGSTGTSLGDDSKVVKELVNMGVDPVQAQQFSRQLPAYWGEKQFTEGPFYFGAVICFLFIFGLLIVRHTLKWWIIGTVVLTMLLSFGKNWPFVSDLFFDYFPFYNKFRTVESILAVAQLCFPLLALLAIHEIINHTQKQLILKKLLIALYITGGLTLIIIVIPDLLLAFKNSSHRDFVAALSQVVNGDMTIANNIANALIADRTSLARTDAIRTLIFIVLSFGLVWAFLKNKVNARLLSIALFALIIADMWPVNKRYLKDDSFVEKHEVHKPQPREVDQFILMDKDPNFRVIDLSQPLLTDATTPYFHKSIGGYSAARLKRYDELIEMQLSKSINQDVLDMLNTKYIISADPQNRALSMKANATACGHAWFVKNIRYAQNADEEMQAISSFDPKNEAIVDKQYQSFINDKTVDYDSEGTIKLVSYHPDHLVYESSTSKSQVAIFSEIYYDKGWKMYIDGKEQPYFRADYVLRAAQLPIGNHKIEFIFHPTSYYNGEAISLAGSIILVLALGGALYTENRRKKTPDNFKK
jgi:hypothetical protein